MYKYVRQEGEKLRRRKKWRNLRQKRKRAKERNTNREGEAERDSKKRNYFGWLSVITTLLISPIHSFILKLTSILVKRFTLEFSPLFLFVIILINFIIGPGHHTRSTGQKEVPHFKRCRFLSALQTWPKITGGWGSTYTTTVKQHVQASLKYTTKYCYHDYRRCRE